MKQILFSLLLLTTATLNAQKVIHDANVEVRPVQSFHAVHVSHGIDLYLSSGDEAVAVSAKSLDFRQHIKTEVKDGVLKIWYEWLDGKNFTIGNNKGLKAYVSYKTLNALSGSGGSDITVDGTIKTASLAINISGGSDFEGGVAVKDLTVSASGGSDIKINGSATTVSIDVSGGSDFSGFNMVTETADIEASGGSDVEIMVTKEVTANASGGSDVRYRGTASGTGIKSSGSSSIKKVSR
jgi:ribosomal protein S6E (S10)